MTEKKDAKDFFDKVASDPELQKQIKEAQGRLLEIAKKHGFEFSQAEMNQHLRERWAVDNPPKFDDVDITTASIAGSAESTDED